MKVPMPICIFTLYQTGPRKENEVTIMFYEVTWSWHMIPLRLFCGQPICNIIGRFLGFIFNNHKLMFPEHSWDNWDTAQALSAQICIR